MTKKNGRPSSYSEEVAEKICHQLLEGVPIRRICSEEGMPSPDTLYKWLKKDPGFAEQYARAREIYADCVFDEIIELCDTATPQTVNCVRLKVDTLKWQLSKMLPRKYGKNLDDTGQEVNIKFIKDPGPGDDEI